MKLVILLLLFAATSFLAKLVCLMFPYWVFKCMRNEKVGRTGQRIMSFGKCASAGVFMGVCFLGLLPYVREKFDEVFKMLHLKVVYPVSEACIVMGYFFVITIEQLIVACQEKDAGREEETRLLVDNVSDTSTTTDDSEDAEGNTNRKNVNKTKHVAHMNNTGHGSPATARVHSPTTHEQGRHSPFVRQGTALGHAPSTFGRAATAMDNRRQSAAFGHPHSHTEAFTTGSTLLLLALAVHMLFEGMAVGLQETTQKAINMFIGVIIHELIVALAIGVNLAKSNITLGTMFKLGVIFASMIPLGIILGMAIGQAHNVVGSLTSGLLQGLAAGTFIYVIFDELLPAEFGAEGDGLLKAGFVFLGFLLIALLQGIL